MPKVKSIIKSATPPWLYQVTKHLLQQPSKVYASFEEAKCACKRTYADQALTQYRIDKAKLNLANLKVEDFVMGLELVIIAILRSKSAKPSIVDFGGALGEQAYILKQLIDKPFDYQVIEHPTLVSKVNNDSFFNYATFSDTLPEACDIFFTSGTLQSIANPFEVMEKAFRIANESVILTRNCFSERPLNRVHTTLIHENGPGHLQPNVALNQIIDYPHQAISYDKLKKMAQQSHWKVALKKKATEDILPHPDYQLFAWDLLYIHTQLKL